jgi:RNA polymerase sigma-70 factor (ECF subfamily)
VTTDTDQRLVTLARDGDLRAFETLVERHRDVVHRVAARVVGEHDADDAAQDTFLRAFHRLDHFRADGSFRAWLLQIAYNTAATSAGRRAADVIPLSEMAEAAPADAPKTPADQIEGAERRRRLDVKVRGLSAAHRTVLVLRDIEGLTYEEIAMVTATPVGSVKARLHRARGDMIDALRRNTYDWDLPDA